MKYTFEMIEIYAQMLTSICLELHSRTNNNSLTYGTLFSQLRKLDKILNLIDSLKESRSRKRITRGIESISNKFEKNPLITEELLKSNHRKSTIKLTEILILEVNNALLKKYAKEKERDDELQKEISQSHQTIETIKKVLEARETGYQFVESSPVVRSLKDKISLMIDNIQKDGTICITGYFDNCLLSDLKKAMNEKHVTVRIIHPTIRGTRGEDRRNLDALKRVMVKRIGEVRYSDLVHARVFLTDDEVVVSSADMKNNSLGGAHFEAGIYSNDLLMVEKVKKFFERIWNESQEKP